MGRIGNRNWKGTGRGLRMCGSGVEGEWYDFFDSEEDWVGIPGR